MAKPTGPDNKQASSPPSSPKLGKRQSATGGADDSDSDDSEAEQAAKAKALLANTKGRDFYRDELQRKDYDDILLLASYTGDTAMVQECFANDAVATTPDNEGFWAGYHAAMSGNVETLKLIMEYDKYGHYIKYFEESITKDNMTPMMMIVRHGHNEVYDFLSQEKGCKLKLLGERFGSKDTDDPDGYSQPLHVWFDLLPELNHPSQVSKRRPLALKLRQIDLNKPPTEDDYDRAKQARLKARNMVRQLLKDAQPLQQERLSYARGSLILPDTDTTNFPASSQRKRGALVSPVVDTKSLGAAVKKQKQQEQAELLIPDFDIEAKLLDGATDQQGDAVVWQCGICNKSHAVSKRELITKGATAIKCKGCKNINLIRPGVGGDAALPGGLEDDSGDGEMWGNEGEEFISEKAVMKHVNVFKKCQLVSLGVQRLRELLRIVEVKSYSKGNTIFQGNAPIKSLYVLKSGTVTVVDAAKGGNAVPDQDLSVEPSLEGDPPNPLKILDMRAFFQKERRTNLDDLKCQRHQATCFAKGQCEVFEFPEEAVAEHCDAGSLKGVVWSSLSLAVIQSVPLLRIAFSDEEASSVAQKLEYLEYGHGDVILAEGYRPDHVILIQKGAIKVTDKTTRKTKKFLISESFQEVPPGEFWMPVFIVGVRLLLYDLHAPYSIQADRSAGIVEAWKLDVKQCEECMRETCLLNHLQTGVHIMYLLRVVLFKKLKPSDPRLRQLLMHTHVREFWQHEDIVVQGDMGDSMYILMEGTVSVMINDEEVCTLQGDLDQDKVQYFGELALIENDPRKATVRVKSSSVTSLCLEREGLEAVFYTVDSLLKEQGLDYAKVLASLKVGKGGKKKTMKSCFDEETTVVEERSKYDGKWDQSLKTEKGDMEKALAKLEGRPLEPEKKKKKPK